MINKIVTSTGKITRKASRYVKLQQAKLCLVNFEKPYKFHVGCGSIKLNEWINIDLEKINEVTDIVWTVDQGFPFAEKNSCSFIYNEHFLEHLSVKEAMIFLKDCYRVLVPNGVLRIAMPSLEYTINKYCSDNWQDQDWLTWKGHEFIKTRAEMINIAFRWWGHKWLYDREELHRRLQEAGFEKIRDVEWGCSEIPELRNLETRRDSILICEACK
ncbi:MAG: methyltransferase domain-containing protein [Microcystis sp. LE17-20A]|nr:MULTISPECIES: methyltransferase domain-containing protein [unclassified Microcystis]MCZ8036836.1 methyltransferase domain-containing protein [Microcystis sp. LE17-20A]MCZ8212386.1 methyltransferase domain-containing protein [Microcystis sp. LE19-8.1F]